MRPTPFDNQLISMDNVDREHWIFGPGAIGALFAANIVRKTSAKKVLYGRQASSRVNFEVEHSGEKVELGISVSGKTPEVEDVRSQTPSVDVTCYFTVHTSDLASAVETSFEFLRRKHPRSVQFVVCSNGILRHDLISKMFEFTFCPATCYRALLYFGASRLEQNNRQIVRHSGGNRIVYGQLSLPPQTLVDEFQPNEFLDWFSWQKTEHIQNVEREKFLMNALLAFYIGPQLLGNENVFSMFSQSEYELWIQHYGALIAPIAFTPSEFDTSFRQLIADTSKNINSYSVKWHAGELAAVDSLLSDFQYQIDNSQSAPAASFMKERINIKLRNFNWPQNARWLS